MMDPNVFLHNKKMGSITFFSDAVYYHYNITFQVSLSLINFREKGMFPGSSEKGYEQENYSCLHCLLVSLFQKQFKQQI